MLSEFQLSFIFILIESLIKTWRFMQFKKVYFQQSSEVKEVLLVDSGKLI